MIQSGGAGRRERRVGLETQHVRLHQGPLRFRRGGPGRLGQALRVAQDRLAEKRFVCDLGLLDGLGGGAVAGFPWRW